MGHLYSHANYHVLKTYNQIIPVLFVNFKNNLELTFGKYTNLLHLALFSLRTESDNPDATCELST